MLLGAVLLHIPSVPVHLGVCAMDNQFSRSIAARASAYAANVPNLTLTPQMDDEVAFCDAQMSGLVTKTWIKAHCRLHDSIFLAYATKDADTPLSVFLVEDAIITNGGQGLGSLVLGKKLASQHVITISRRNSPRRIWLSARNKVTMDLWVQALLKTGSCERADRQGV